MTRTEVPATPVCRPRFRGSGLSSHVDADDRDNSPPSATARLKGLLVVEWPVGRRGALSLSTLVVHFELQLVDPQKSA